MKEWNEKQVARILAVAAEQKTGTIDNEIAKTLSKEKVFEGRTVNSIRAKAVSEGVYQKADAPRKVGGETAKRKIEFVRGAEILLNLKQGSLDTLEKASKADLEALTGALTTLSDNYNAELEASEPSDSEPSDD